MIKGVKARQEGKVERKEQIKGGWQEEIKEERGSLKSETREERKRKREK